MIMVSRDQSGAVYRQVAAQIRDLIDAGTYPAETQLPAETYLAGEYGVGRDTVRRALHLLRDTGVIQSGGDGQRWRVLPHVPVKLVAIPRGSEWESRPPTEQEIDQEKWPRQVNVVEVTFGPRVWKYRADQVRFKSS